METNTNNYLQIIICLVVGVFSLTAASWANAQAPTVAEIETLMRAKFEKAAAPGLDGRKAIEINSLKIGRTAPATAQEVINGIPRGGEVTPILVDFTIKVYYRTATDVIQRVQQAAVYKNKFDEWALMPGATVGEDKRSREPAQ